MRRLLVRGGLVASAALLLAGCGHDNTDPRDGRVVIDSSNCLVGDCYVIYKVCHGPDLLYHDSASDKAHRERLIRDSPQCDVSKP